MTAMSWTKVTAGKYVSADGYTVERETYSNSFRETRSQWRVILNERIVWIDTTFAKAKHAAERYAAKKAAGLCWFPACNNPATGTTPGIRVSVTYDIDTCDRCHQRATGRPRTAN